MAEHDDLGLRVELADPPRHFPHGDEGRAVDARDGVFGGLPDVEEDDARPAPAGRGLGGVDLGRRGQKPSSTLVTSDCAKRPASASIATFSRSE